MTFVLIFIKKYSCDIWVLFFDLKSNPDSKVHGANTGPIWGRHNPGEPHIGPMNFAIWEVFRCMSSISALASLD